MKINPVDYLTLTCEERTLLDKAAKIIKYISDHSTTNGELEKIAQTLDEAMYDLLTYEFLEVE